MKWESQEDRFHDEVKSGELLSSAHERAFTQMRNGKWKRLLAMVKATPQNIRVHIRVYGRIPGGEPFLDSLKRQRPSLFDPADLQCLDEVVQILGKD